MADGHLLAVDGLDILTPACEGFLQGETDGEFDVVTVAFKKRMGFLRAASQQGNCVPSRKKTNSPLPL